MDKFSGICLSLLISVAVFTSSTSATLYLQPQTKEHGFFTGDSFFVTCFTTDPTLDKVTWFDGDRSPIRDTQGRVHTQVSEGPEKGLRLVFTSFEKEDGGKYSCTDDSGSVDVEIIIYRSVSFGDTEHEQHGAEGESATVICNVKSDPKPLVNWMFKGQSIQSNEKYKILENHSLRINKLERNDTGDYVCKAFVITSHNTQVKDFTIKLNVQYKPEVVGESRLSVFSMIGKTANLLCNITSEPKPLFQWLHDEMIIHNNSGKFLIFNTQNSSVLQMTVDDEERFGEYMCRGNNPLGEKEVIIELKEGATPLAPELTVSGEERGVVRLSLRVSQEDRRRSEELKVDGFKVEFVLASEAWDKATALDFVVGEAYELRNMSYNSDYLLRAAAHNAAGYGNLTEEITYRTLTPETAQVTSGASILTHTVVLLLGLILIL